jgi:hypothetical protein
VQHVGKLKYESSHVDAGMYKVSSKFKGDITIAGNNIILVLILNTYLKRHKNMSD